MFARAQRLMLQPVPRFMTHDPRAVSVEEISGWIRDSAASEVTAQATNGQGIGQAAAPVSEHSARIGSSLHRARTKNFVRALKPFRRILRNQGAVNDSLIEAVHHLAAENQQMMEQIEDLRSVVQALRSQLRRVPAGDVPSAEESRDVSPGDAANRKG
jgi:hypothetical protein